MDREFVFAGKNDFEDIISLWIDCFDDDREYIEDFFARYYNDKRIVVLKDKGKVIAMASLFSVDVDGRNGIYIFALGVDKSYRGRGIASRMLDFIQNSDGCILVLQPEQNGVENFYKKIGFELFDADKLDVVINKYGLDELTLGHYDGFIRKRI